MYGDQSGEFVLKGFKCYNNTVITYNNIPLFLYISGTIFFDILYTALFFMYNS